MSRLTVIVSLVCTVGLAALSLSAETDASSRRRVTYEKKMAQRAKMIAAAGGLIEKPYVGKYVYIVNDQNIVEERDFFANEAASFAGIFNLPVRIVGPKTELEKPGLTITLSDNDSAPTLLVAPEVPWAGVNVRALAGDKPKKEVLVARLRKELWRAFMFACGAANSQMQPCVMRQIMTPADLDVHPNIVPCPDSMPRVFKTAQILGIANKRSVTYKQACTEGWAPPPTNDVQKAVWDKVHAIPSKPIKIEYNEKRDKGK